MLGTPLLINWLRARGIGQQIREDGPGSHLTKAGTPTMGGLALASPPPVAGYLVSHVKATFTTRGLVALLAIAASAGIGLIDDWIKVHRQRSLGLNKRAKIAGQLIIAVAFAVACVTWLKVDTHLSFTRYNSLGIDLGKVGWVIFAVLVIVGCSNAVNLTDGLDGLAAGSSTFSFAAFTVIGFYQFKHFNIYGNPAPLDEAALAAALVGGCAGFLWFNAAPARIFMGDTGSLGIGTGVATLALLENVDLLLPIIGGLFVVEALSVIIQVGSFRLFRRRVFRMAPIHHHFELLGWPETTVIIRFWILAGLFTALALGAFYADFLSHRGAGLGRRRVVVVGFGVTGRAVARMLVAAGDRVVVLDDHPTADGGQAAAAEIGVALGGDTPDPASLGGPDRRVGSRRAQPGVPVAHPIYARRPAGGHRAGVGDRAGRRDGQSPARVGRTPAIGGHHRYQRQDDGDDLGHGHPQPVRPAGRAAGKSDCPWSRPSASGADVIVAEVSFVPVAVHQTVPARGELLAEPGRRSPRLASDSRALRRAKPRIWANQGPGDTAVLQRRRPGRGGGRLHRPSTG